MGCGHSKHDEKKENAPCNDMRSDLHARDLEKHSGGLNEKHEQLRVSSKALKYMGPGTGLPGDPFEDELKNLSAKAAVSQALIPDSDSDSENDNIEYKQQGHSSSSITALVNLLKKHILFKDCAEHFLLLFAQNMEIETVEKNTEIIRQGDMIDSTRDKMFIVQNGFLQIQISGGHSSGPKVFTQTTGCIFGEIALICETLRSATVKTLTKCTLFSCKRPAVMRLAASRTLLFIRRIPFLKTMSDNQIFEILEKAQYRTFKKGDYIIKYGDVKDTNVHFIRRGTVVIRRPIFGQIETSGSTLDHPEMKKVAVMTRGQMLGQRVILTGKMRSADCIADGEVITVSFTSADFLNMDTPFLNRWLDLEASSTVLNAIFGYSPAAIEQNCHELYQFHHKRFREGDIVYNKGSKVYGLHIVRSGQISSSQSQVSILEAGGYSYFGKVHSVCIYDHDFVAKSDLAVLVEDDINKHRKPSSETSESIDHDENIDFKDLKIGKMIGIGTSGRVFLTTHSNSGKIFALKAMDKSKLRHAKQIEHTQNELRILKKINHPFCTKFYSAYQDLRHLYVLQEFIAGGEFFGYMQSGKGFREDVSKFYAANVLLALQHLHDRSVIYRDLKPENLLLDRDGYIKIADFGFAKDLKTKQRTYTICGTPAYQAPEIIAKSGTGFQADIWSFGILVYEMSFGKTPFENPESSSTEDPLQIYKKVLSGRFTIPKTASKDLADLLYAILVIKSEQRLSLSDIREHQWFKDFPWDDLQKRTLQAPFRPELSSIADTSHFDTFDEITSFLDISPDSRNSEMRVNQSILWPGWMPIKIQSSNIAQS